MISLLREAGVWVGAALMLAVGGIMAIVITAAPTIFAIVAGLWIASLLGIIW